MGLKSEFGCFLIILKEGSFYVLGMRLLAQTYTSFETYFQGLFEEYQNIYIYIYIYIYIEREREREREREKGG